jgi:hypothetical protein
MPHDTQPAFGDLIGKRLMELVRAGILTPQEWQTAVRNSAVSLGVITHYLERCLQGPSSHGSKAA